MKTIKSIKATKNVELGTIKRVGEKEADSEVRGGYWKYVPKSEYKGVNRKQEIVTDQPQTEQSPTKTKKNAKKNS